MLSITATTELDPFSTQTLALLDRAAAFCATRASRLTETRRLVLGLILQSHKPLGPMIFSTICASTSATRLPRLSIARSIFCSPRG